MRITLFSNIVDNHCVPKWVCVIAKLFGFWPYSLCATAKTASKTFVSDIWDLLWSFAVVIIISAGIYGQCSTIYILHSIEFSSVEVIINSVTVAGYGIVSIIGILMAIWKRKTFLEFIEIIRNVDHEFCVIQLNRRKILNKHLFLCQIAADHHFIDERRKAHKLFWWCAILAILIVYGLKVFASFAVSGQILKLDHSSSLPTIISWLSYFLLLNAQLALAILYTYLLVCIWIRFWAINRLAMQRCGVASDEIPQVDRWFKWHDALVDALRVINQCYSFPVG